MLRVWSFMREGFTFSQALLITVIFAVLIAIFKGPVRKYMDGRRYVNKVRQSYIDLISKFGLQMTTDKVLAKFKEDKLGKLIYQSFGDSVDTKSIWMSYLTIDAHSTMANVTFEIPGNHKTHVIRMDQLSNDVGDPSLKDAVYQFSNTVVATLRQQKPSVSCEQEMSREIYYLGMRAGSATFLCLNDLMRYELNDGPIYPGYKRGDQVFYVGLHDRKEPRNPYARRKRQYYQSDFRYELRLPLIWAMRLYLRGNHTIAINFTEEDREIIKKYYDLTAERGKKNVSQHT